jgi:hypothetical protein
VAWTSFSPPTDGRSTGGILMVAMEAVTLSCRSRWSASRRGY